MKINLETRNIFTRRGRINRRIDKHKKLCEKIGNMDEVLAILNGNKNEPKHQPVNNSTILDECVICCDGCDYEFNIFSEDIKTVSIPKIDNGDISIETEYICPNCGYHNEIELDNEDDDIEDDDIIEEDLEDESNSDIEVNDDNDIDDIDYNEDDTSLDKIFDTINTNQELIDKFSDDGECSDEQCTKQKISKEINININNKKNKSHKVIINKSNPIKIITDNKILNSIDIALKHESTIDTICSLAGNNIAMKIDMVTATDKDIIGYTSDAGEISFTCSRDNKESIMVFTINTKLAYIPHGSHNNIYNNIMAQLNIVKVSNECEDIGLPGKAYVIKLHDGSIAACNFMIKNNNIIITIIYDINKD